MSNNLLSALERSCSFAEQVVGAVPDDMRSRRTPCPKYDVSALVGHLSSGIHWFSRIPEHGVSDPVQIDDEDLAGRDLLAVLRAETGFARAAWTAPDLDRVFSTPFGEMPGSGLVSFMVLELLGHALDVALATGQARRPDDDLANLAIAVATGVGEMLRSPGMMGAEVPVAADAPAADRLLGFIGRDPAWAAPAE